MPEYRVELRVKDTTPSQDLMAEEVEQVLTAWNPIVGAALTVRHIDLVDKSEPDPDPDDEDPGPFCLGCGCSQLRACPGGCIWATATLCSRCALA